MVVVTVQTTKVTQEVDPSNRVVTVEADHHLTEVVVEVNTSKDRKHSKCVCVYQCVCVSVCVHNV